MCIVGWLAIKCCGFHHHLYIELRGNKMWGSQGISRPMPIAFWAKCWLIVCCSLGCFVEHFSDEFPQKKKEQNSPELWDFHIRSTSKNLEKWQGLHVVGDAREQAKHLCESQQIQCILCTLLWGPPMVLSLQHNDRPWEFLKPQLLRVRTWSPRGWRICTLYMIQW